MDDKLQNLYQECVQELNKIGIDIENKQQIGTIEIKLSNRSKKRYGICKLY